MTANNGWTVGLTETPPPPPPAALADFPNGPACATELEIGGRVAGLRGSISALCWLRWHELVGRKGRAAAAGIFAWITSLAVLTFAAAQQSEAADELLLAAAAGSFLAWTVAPLLGAGGNEVAGATRMAPYPVDPRASFWATWITTMWDAPALLIAPTLLGAATAAGGPAGFVVAVALAFGASALGQAGAWLATFALAGRSWKAAAVGGAAVAALFAVIAATGSVTGVVRVLPPGWAVSAVEAADAGSWATFVLWLLLVVGVGIVGAYAGVRLHLAATGREMRLESVQHKRLSGRPLPAGVFGSLAVVTFRSIARATTTKLVVVTAQLTPLIGGLAASRSVYEPTGASIVSIVSFACAATLGLNMFAFDAGGAVMLIGAPVRRSIIVAAKATVLAGLLTAVSMGALVVAAVTGGLDSETAASAGRALAAYVPAFTGLCLLWSAKRPAAADHDSLRARPSGARSSMSFVAAGVGIMGALTILEATFPAGGVMFGVSLGALMLMRASKALDRNAEEVAVAVAG